MRVGVTGAGGRLGQALVRALREAPFTGPGGPIAWTRQAFDLDAPGSVGELLDRDRVEVVVHAAAWTDVDACAREPGLALARNGEATGVLARACATRGIDLIAFSTNEVFDGRRTDGIGYGPGDAMAPANPYGASKAAGERLARDAYERPTRAQLAIVRTAWLFGPGKPDFPTKILMAAQEAARTAEPLRVTGDEWGCPTYTADVADAVVELLAENAFGGIHHVVNGLFATRADWARYVVGRAMLAVDVENVPMASWQRDSTPPRWGVLEPTPLPSGEPLRLWPDAMADYAPMLLRETAGGHRVGR
ncbi:MAG TPA: NAD(P)-dependent oxidoreductase [Candidatus Limnocylindrales bacterium]|nr:NAD(P)-dependent oxidoreductase [Candidatus Limnocylindrales bacterium]